MKRLQPITEEELIRRAEDRWEQLRWRMFWVGFAAFVLASLLAAWLLWQGRL